jgi:hypothetical protein
VLAVVSDLEPHRSSGVPGRATLLGRLDAVQCQPTVDVGGVEADQVADLVVRDPSLVDEPTDEALGDAEAAGEIDDVQQSGSGGPWSWCGCHISDNGHAAVDRGECR